MVAAFRTVSEPAIVALTGTLSLFNKLTNKVQQIEILFHSAFCLCCVQEVCNWERLS